MLAIYSPVITSVTSRTATSLTRFSFLISTATTHNKEKSTLTQQGPGPWPSRRRYHTHTTPQKHHHRQQQKLAPSSPPSRRMASTTPTTNKHDKDATQPPNPPIIHFGPFEVTNQVFLTTPYSFALVNLKPLLPGHVLVCPLRPAKRLTDLSPAEVTDLFTAVQRVQRMLARYYFTSTSTTPEGQGQCTLGSFNIAVQDGPEAGQTVAHVHVHVIPRIRGSTAKDAETPSDELYDRMAGEDGNVGGQQWDCEQRKGKGGRGQRGIEGDGEEGSERPVPGGKFPSIEDSERLARGMEEMEREAGVYRVVLRELELEGRG